MLRAAASNEGAGFRQAIAKGIWKVTPIEAIPDFLIHGSDSDADDLDADSHGGDKLVFD